MAMSLNELLGEKLVQNNESDNKLNEETTSQLDGKTVALYFSFVYLKLIFKKKILFL
jgi:hypothetical protein